MFALITQLFILKINQLNKEEKEILTIFFGFFVLLSHFKKNRLQKSQSQIRDVTAQGSETIKNIPKNILSNQDNSSQTAVN